jgi:hypothetical protein
MRKRSKKSKRSKQSRSKKKCRREMKKRKKQVQMPTCEPLLYGQLLWTAHWY